MGHPRRDRPPHSGERPVLPVVAEEYRGEDHHEHDVGSNTGHCGDSIVKLMTIASSRTWNRSASSEITAPASSPCASR